MQRLPRLEWPLFGDRIKGLIVRLRAGNRLMALSQPAIPLKLQDLAPPGLEVPENRQS